jgi:hypothetical protein
MLGESELGRKLSFTETNSEIVTLLKYETERSMERLEMDFWLLHA